MSTKITSNLTIRRATKLTPNSPAGTYATEILKQFVVVKPNANDPGTIVFEEGVPPRISSVYNLSFDYFLAKEAAFHVNVTV